MAHLPVGNTDPVHLGLPLILAATFLVGEAVAVKPVFSTQSGLPG